MDDKFKLIPDIYPTQRDWTTKVIVTGKLAPKISKQNQSRYQHLILMDLKDGNIDKLNEIIEEKPYLVLTPSKLSPPEESQFTTIKRVHSLLLGYSSYCKVSNVIELQKSAQLTQPKYFWIKAIAFIKVMRQSFWYIACNNCNRVSNANLGETYQCVYCKCSQTKAVPRAKAYVQLEDSTGVLNANVIGEPAEKLLQCSSETLMQQSKSSTTNIHDAIQMAVDKQQLLYVKATQRLLNKTKYKFEIIFILDTCLAITQIEHSKVDKGKCLLYPDLPTEPALIEEVSSLLAKRALFQLPDEDSVAKKKIETNTNDPNLLSALINVKPKSE
ncbi:replication protein A 70 kDa DNA-binding subunit D-like [Forsythia ovata]|uniref:Replication protein A 70 kDa DNA-binding subunit D-like n=1 Tax=Forsythia ovata TaxID=205694 RepID=A0ABD1NVT9_9LAMI